MKDDPEKELLKFVHMSLLQINSQLIPIILDTWKLSYNMNINCNEWLNNISIIDEKCHLALNNNVSRRSSINQGKCFLRASKEAFFTNNNISNSNDQEKIQKLSLIIQTTSSNNNDNNNHIIYGHYATIFGLVCGLLDISEILTRKIFLRCFIRDIFSSAYRLNVIGPLEGANLQATVCTNLDKRKVSNNRSINTKKRKTCSINDDKNAINPNSNTDNNVGNNRDDNVDIDINDNVDNNSNKNDSDHDSSPVTTVPILEILQGRHDLLYARLFNS